MSASQIIELKSGWEFCEVKPQGPLEPIKPTGVSVFNYPVTPGARSVTTGTAPSADLTPSDAQILGLAEKKDVEWIGVKAIPSEVTAELWKKGKIANPYTEMAEWEHQWVSESAWIWRGEFLIPENSASNVDLVFEGLDTVCHVFVDDHKVLDTDNMFAGDVVQLKHRKYPASLSKPGKHRIILYFESAFRKARALEQVYGKRIASHAQEARVYLRKAQFNWQWDWGPRLLTVGPWQPITLEIYDLKIQNVYARAHVRDDLSAEFKVTVDLEGTVSNASVKIELSSPSGEKLQTYRAKVDGREVNASWEFESDELDLWWPYQIGKPNLHTVNVEVEQSGTILDSSTVKTGVRSVKLIEEGLTDQPGSSWLFEINGVRMFLAGSNWIPADSIPTRMCDERYVAWVDLLVEGNQNVLRIWGGGLYEPHLFYDRCDEQGIMVMHDFAFGCGLYPKHEAFAKSVEKEIVYQLKRLRNHPSIIFWAGNNEDYQKAEFFEKYDALKNVPAEEDENMPARVFYEDLFPRKIKELMDPPVPYQASSPFQGRWVNDPTIGDSHMWRVWSGDKRPYQEWDQLSARFVSEFGMHGYPNMATIKDMLGKRFEKDGYINSIVMDEHNKGGPSTLMSYVNDNLRFTTDLNSYLYATQLMQAECLEQAYRNWMRNFKGRGREFTAGAVVWQLNDCWPCISWSLVDFFLRRKPAFYTVKRALAPLAVSIKRQTKRTYTDYQNTSNDTQIVTMQPYYQTAARYDETVTIAVWVYNSSLESRTAKLVVDTWDIATGKKLDSQTHDRVHATAVQSTDVLRFQIDPKTAPDVVVSTRLYDGDQVIARHCSWPEPLKYVRLPSPDDVGVSVTLQNETLRITSKTPVKGVVFDHSKRVQIDDNCLDIMPDDPQEVSAKGASGTEPVTYRYYGDSERRTAKA